MVALGKLSRRSAIGAVQKIVSPMPVVFTTRMRALVSRGSGANGPGTKRRACRRAQPSAMRVVSRGDLAMISHEAVFALRAEGCRKPHVGAAARALLAVALE